VEKLDAAQLDQLKEIGAHLQQVRQSQSRSLEEIATKTCIRLPLLQALEAGHGQILPEPVFVQGFIRRYADLLGLDGTSLARTFFVNRGMVVNPDLPIKSKAEPAYLTPPSVVPKGKFSESKFAESKPSESKFAESQSSESKFAALSSVFEQDGRSPFQSKAAYVVYALLAALTLGGIVRSFFTANSPSPVATASSPTIAKPAVPHVKAAAPALPSPAAQASPVPVTIDSPPSEASPSPGSAAIGNAPVSVAMRLTDEAWIQVLVDGKLDYEGTLPKGTTRNWSAKRQITVLSGNAGAVSLSANNGASKPMGSLGDVKEMTVTAKN
jgi:cytoskeleton protein RodZ